MGAAECFVLLTLGTWHDVCTREQGQLWRKGPVEGGGDLCWRPEGGCPASTFLGKSSLQISTTTRKCGFDSVCRQRKVAKRPYLGRGDTLLRLGGLGGLGLSRAHSLLPKWCLCRSDYGSSWLPPHQGQKLRTLNMFSFFPFP